MNILPAASNTASGFNRIQNMDVVQHTIREFLPPSDLAISSSASHFFNTMMGHQVTWKKIAVKLQITLQNSDTAKKEVDTHLKAIKCAIQIFPKAVRPVLNSIKDPFELHDKILAGLKNAEYSITSQTADNLISNFHQFLFDMNPKIGTLEGLNKDMLLIAIMLIKHGVMKYAQPDDFKVSFLQMRGRHELGTDGIFYYCPEHLILFQLTLDVVKNSEDFSPIQKQRIMEDATLALYQWDVPRSLNYPTNFINVALEAGMRPTKSLMWRAIDSCPIDLWGRKVGSPIVQLLDRATNTERNAFLNEIPAWEDTLMENIENFLEKALDGDLDADSLKERSEILAHSYVNWSELVCLVANKDYVADQKKRQTRATWLLARIDSEEKNPLPQEGKKANVAERLSTYSYFKKDVQAALKISKGAK